jgi:hypothetical protein
MLQQLYDIFERTIYVSEPGFRFHVHDKRFDHGRLDAEATDFIEARLIR